MTDWGRRAANRLGEMAKISAAGPGVTRLPFTREHKMAVALLTKWMKEAGLNVHLDEAGTLVGRHQGQPDAGTFYMGSHQDSIREGGAYDGIMGVVLSILTMERLKKNGVLPSFSVEVLAFADEEGVRWPTALIGSRAIAGTYDPSILNMKDRDGVTLREAIETFGLKPDRIGALKRSKDKALGFLETHIEQGPVLEERDIPLGIVTAICGIERHLMIVTGETGHAGTLPMASRRDALVGAASLVTEINRLANSTQDLRATVGQMNVFPNIVNAIPSEVHFTVELRSPDDEIRSAAGRHLHIWVEKAMSEAGLHLSAECTYRQPAQPCDARLSAQLAQAIPDIAKDRLRLPSGATHDASAMADLCPVAMLFVRCREGLSHSPREFAAARDLGHAIDTLTCFLGRFDAGQDIGT